MSIRFLNCLSIRPYFPRVVGGVTVLLVETNQGPVLVDSGIGTRDYQARGLMRLFLKGLRSRFDLNETAFYQVQRLGFKPEDVRHIIQTHLHLDHAGGLPDFPHAKVHLYKLEYDHIMHRPGWEFYPGHWAHGPNWVIHELKGGQWYDFDAIHLESIVPEIWLVPLTGHTPGHTAVAVKREQGWVLYGSDALPFNVLVDEVPDRISKIFNGPHIPRIRGFMKSHPEVQVVGAHMSLDFYEGIS